MTQIEKKINKYEIILANLTENKANKTPGDDYPYDLDIKNTEGYLKDLRACVPAKPTEESVVDAIIDSVSIRGISLEDYKREFTNERSGLFDVLNKIYGV